MTRRGTALPQPRRQPEPRPMPLEPRPYAGDPYELRYRVGGLPPVTRHPEPRRLHPAVIIGWTVLTLAAVAWIVFSLITY